MSSSTMGVETRSINEDVGVLPIAKAVTRREVKSMSLKSARVVRPKR